MSKTRITGYQVELATNKAFTKNMKRFSQRGFKKALRMIPNLKENKKYFVRVRTYKTINEKNIFLNGQGDGRDNSQKFYTKYSFELRIYKIFRNFIFTC